MLVIPLTLRLFVVQMVVLGTLQSVTAADDLAVWNIGLASRNITPTEPVRMAGYGSKEREQLSEGVACELFAKAMAIQDASGHRALMVTTDVIGLTAAVSEPLYDRIQKETGLQRHQILINSSHTHTGPAIGLDEEKLSWLKNSDHLAATIRYSKKLSDDIVALAVEANANMKPCRLSWGVGVATFVMNRREFTERGVRLGVNPRGLADRSVPVLKVESADGKLTAVLIGTACHNTTMSGKDMQISGDYAGYVQQQIEKRFDGVQAMFMQGCGGDANPFPQGGEAVARIHGSTLADEVARVLGTKLTPVNGPLTTLLHPVDLPLQRQISESDYDKLDRASGSTRAVAEKLREQLKSDEGLPGSYSTQIALWQFGDDLTLVGLPGEVVVDYVSMLEEAIGPRKLWVTAYNHDVFGYLPSARVLREGGYEMRGVYAGGLGIFSPRVDEVVVKAVSKLAEEAGRK